ncbi:MAG: hypothetical protein NTV62_01570, partial [Candidatus Gribaldobacteria bacterium]|nr:hypothetical protein [Candidatus Gribaldobacteria bacterium]
SRLFTSARRAVRMLDKFNLPPFSQWEQGFSAFDDEVRKLESGVENAPGVNYNDRTVLDNLKNGLEYIVNGTIDSYERMNSLGKDHEVYKKVLGLMGIKYKLNKEGNIVFTDTTRLINGLKNYKEEGVLIRDAKSGKPRAGADLKRLRSLRKRP